MYRPTLLLLCIVFFAGVAAPQQPAHKLVQFQMAIVRKGPNWKNDKSVYVPPLHQHIDYVNSLITSGKVVMAGLSGDTLASGIIDVVIFRTSSADEAKGWANEDPALKAGFVVNEMHPWWSEDIFKPATTPLTLRPVFLVFLKKGPNRKEGDDKDPEIQELQKAHIANIQRLAGEHKLAVAGPFGDDGELRGIFILRVKRYEEARDLCATDPMVKVGRLVAELHPWDVFEGMIP